jgi:tetratricopeptide (TPR) repeat protein
LFDVFLFPNKSIAGIFWAALLLFIIPFIIKRKIRGIFIVLLLLITLLTGLLVASNSRAGWLGFAAGVIYIICFLIPSNKRKIFLLSAALGLLFLFITLLFYKPGSSSGRKHIYSISFSMFSDNWQKGIGLGKFKARFNEYQANYFSINDIDSKRALLADNTFYAFNDYLQWSIETGFAGLLSIILFLYLTVTRIIYLHKRNSNRPVLISAIAALISIAIAALFSYPLQIISIQAVVLACLGIITFYPGLNEVVSTRHKLIIFFYKGVMIILISFFVSNTCKAVDKKRMQNYAFELARSGYKIKAINKYKQLLEKYPQTGHTWFAYAQQLYYSNRLTEAIKSLDNCKRYYTDNKVYKLKADIELELNRYEAAENDYLRTIYMVPNRMGSRFDLLNFYITRKDSAKAVYWAKSILKMPVKVPSSKVENMLRETKSILDKIEK